MGKIATAAGTTLLLVVLGAVRAETTDPQYWVYLPIYHHTITRSQGVGYILQRDGPYTCDGLDLVGAEWFFNWSAEENPIGCVAEFVPMYWGKTWVDRYTPEGDSGVILGCNEPEFAGQCNSTPAEYAPVQIKIEDKHPDLRIGSPSVTRLSWLIDARQAFIDEHGRPPRWDILVIHCYPELAIWYSAPVDAYVNYCKNQADDAIELAQAWGIGEVWVTEYALRPEVPGEDVALEFMRRMETFYRDTPEITRRAWFALDEVAPRIWPLAYDTSLIIDGELTPFGKAYRD